VVELMVGRSVMSVVVAEHTVERERKERKTERVGETGKRLIFWLFLDPIFSSFKPSNPPLFIGGGRGQSCLH
jgi:hypothetical protein